MKKFWFVVTIALLTAVIATPIAAQHYRNRGVTVSDYYQYGNGLVVICDVWEDCESGSFDLSIDYRHGRHYRTLEARGFWRNNATSAVIQVQLMRDSIVLGVVVTAVRPDC